MSKSKFVAGLASAALLGTAVAVVPTASAVELHVEQRNGRDICVATLSDAETEFSKEYFATLIEKHKELENELRAQFPELSDEFAEIDQMWIENPDWARVYGTLSIHDALVSKGFSRLEADFFAFTNSDLENEYQSYVDDGFPVNIEILADWSKADMADYPFGTAPIINVGADWSSSETSSSILDAWSDAEFVSSNLTGVPFGYSDALKPIIAPYGYQVQEAEDRLTDFYSQAAIRSAVEDCAAGVSEELTPPVTSPTVTVTASPVIVTETPEAVTTTVAPETIVVEPTPITETAEPTTVTETPDPVTVTAAPTTVTKPGGTVTATAEPITETATPTVTETAEPSTITETPEPVTVTAEPSVITETAAPTTVTEPGETVTETAEPTIVTVTPTVTETAEPTKTTKPADEEKEEGSSALPVFGIFAAIIAALGGLLAFAVPQLGTIASLLP
ncbi:hypothetical protein [Corynebacterium halotolerans]|uniref:Uncharacterized protein n=1 Tax=Corynebacterium halotolerans YIM 70093 = DSM 44683 TaxID=1121362 RepID=M1MZA3_9CORY|nr:hypothetical protein [Corynebacterium halotolerans]AGF73009.1 hypothetical protein A605_10035 [Corynebacterium halotolerans YIM 70093 = DSM 44683]